MRNAKSFFLTKKTTHDIYCRIRRQLMTYEVSNRDQITEITEII